MQASVKKYICCIQGDTTLTYDNQDLSQEFSNSCSNLEVILNDHLHQMSHQTFEVMVSYLPLILSTLKQVNLLLCTLQGSV
jgi:hypothetical protein